MFFASAATVSSVTSVLFTCADMGFLKGPVCSVSLVSYLIYDEKKALSTHLLHHISVTTTEMLMCERLFKNKPAYRTTPTSPVWRFGSNKYAGEE